MPIKVAITDDHPLAIEGLQNMLAYSSDIIISGVYTTGGALLEGLIKEQPDILLLDLLLPDQTGTDLATIITQTYSAIHIIVITSLDAPVHVRSMMHLGCKGYILKNTDKQSLISAIKDVHEGGEYIDPLIKERMMYNVLNYRKMNLDSQTLPQLTQREKEILKLVVEEKSNQEIADILFLSLRTVETHRFNLQRKLQVNNNIALVKIAIQMGLVE